MTDTPSAHGELPELPNGGQSDSRIPTEVYDRYLTGEATPQDQVALDRWSTTEHRGRLLNALRETHFPVADRTERAVALLRERLGLGVSVSFGGQSGRHALRVKSRGDGRGYLGRQAVRLEPRTTRAALWIAVMAIMVGSFGLLARRRWEPRGGAAHVYATQAYQRATITLDDGTRVTLAPQTTLRILPFGGRARTVILESGEAYFAVAHAAKAPFVVRSGSATTQVLGTEFFIRYNPRDARVRVAVADGKVRVLNLLYGKSDVMLTTGQIVDVKDSTMHMSTADDLAPGTEVEPGRIVFRDTPLATVLQTISRWYGYQFRYSDQTLGTQSVTMTVSTRSSFEALATIERVLAVNLTVVGDTVTLVAQPPTSGHSAPRIRTYDVWSPKQEVGR